MSLYLKFMSTSSENRTTIKEIHLDDRVNKGHNLTNTGSMSKLNKVCVEEKGRSCEGHFWCVVNPFTYGLALPQCHKIWY